MKQQLGFGILGCGVISKWHAEAIVAQEDCVLVGVADYSRERATAFSKDYPCRVFENAEQLLASPEIDVVCICTPSGLHAEYAVLSAKAGKHFIVEKPMAITKEQIQQMIDACEEHRVKGSVISQLRFSPAVGAVKSAIEQGALGRILLAELSMKYHRSPAYYQNSSWRGTVAMDGGGALMNQGIHGIDVLQYLVGPVRSVGGLCRTLVHSVEVEDTASLTVEFQNGAVGTITGTTSLPVGSPRVIEINGTAGRVVLTEDRITHWEVAGLPMPHSSTAKEEDFGHNDPAKIPMHNHEKQIRDMIEAIRQDRRPLVDLGEGKRAVEIILAAYESSKTGKCVKLSE